MHSKTTTDSSPPKKEFHKKVCVSQKSVVTLKQLNAITNCLVNFVLL